MLRTYQSSQKGLVIFAHSDDPVFVETCKNEKIERKKSLVETIIKSNYLTCLGCCGVELVFILIKSHEGLEQETNTELIANLFYLIERGYSKTLELLPIIMIRVKVCIWIILINI